MSLDTTNTFLYYSTMEEVEKIVKKLKLKDDDHITDIKYTEFGKTLNKVFVLVATSSKLKGYHKWENVNKDYPPLNMFTAQFGKFPDLYNSTKTDGWSLVKGGLVENL